jgi:phosphatidate cytidylyltransferase
MNKAIQHTIGQRLLTFFIGIPAILLLVFVAPYHHILLQFAIIATTFIASGEMYYLLGKTSPMQNKPLVIGVALTLPVMGLVCSFIGKPFEYITYMLLVDILFLFFCEVFFSTPSQTSSNRFADSNNKLASSFFILVYVGFLITFLSRLTDWKNSTQYLAVFFLMVFFCDSFAWFFGNLLGNGNRGICKASPNKSIVGFIGGFLGSQFAAAGGFYLWHNSFPGPRFKIILIGVFVSIAAIVGDLAESLFKRSSDSKDSGNVIPGRGGLLDSIDSILMAAPVYYFSVKLLFDL